jgi:O-antigen ligase
LLLYASIGLLILSTADSGPLGSVATVCWLASFAVLALTNIGSAFAVYIGSLAIYSPLHFGGGSSVLQRPDNIALVVLLLGLVLIFSKQRGRLRYNLYVLAFLTFCILHGMLFPPTYYEHLLRSLVIPLLLCELFALAKFGENDLDALQTGLAVLGGYMGLVSILEQIRAYDWIIPRWVGNPSLRPFDPFLEGWIGAGRSGGTLLQPAWNGLLLSLIVLFLLMRWHRMRTVWRAVAISLCMVGSFFTYTRGVWLGLALSLMWFPGWCRSSRQAFVRRAGLACGALVLLQLLAGGTASERMQDSNTIYYRLKLWGAGARLVGAHPLLGVGFFHFGDAMAGVNQGFGAVSARLPDVEGGVASHNTPLTVLVEFGVVGFLLYAMAFYKIVRRAKDNLGRLWGRSGAAWVLAFAIVYLVNAQFVSAFEGTTNVAFFGLLGVMASLETPRWPPPCESDRNGRHRSRSAMDKIRSPFKDLLYESPRMPDSR